MTVALAGKDGNLCHNQPTMLVIASGEFLEGNVLSFRFFPTPPHSLRFVLTFHAGGEVRGEIAYRVRKWDEVIHQTEPRPFVLSDERGTERVSHADSIEVTFPSQGPYNLDVLFDGALLHSMPFSVFDSSNRADLEQEIIHYLKRKRGARSVQDITRGVFNPKLLNKKNLREFSGRVYLALLRMKEVTNTKPVQQGNLEEKMNASQWVLKE